jgi:hypothetical protein
MSTLSARFTQGPKEVKRYLLDYTLFLVTGESVVSIAQSVSNLGMPPQGSPPLVVSTIVLGPGGLQALYLISGGVDGQSYEVTFLATTSVGQVLEDVVQYDIAEKNNT